MKTLHELFPHYSQNPNFTFESITNDSREASDKSLFLAYTGFEIDLHRFISNAYTQGCRYFLISRGYLEQLSQEFPDAHFFVSDDLLEDSAKIIWNFYNYPDKDLKIIAITGTNGKTTTATIINQSLKAMGQKTAFFGTTEWSIGDVVYPSLNTSPDLIVLAKMLTQARDEGVEFVVMEAASHAMSLGRVKFLNIDCAGFTNLTQDHLDFHKDFESYYQAKAQLFHENLAYSSKQNAKAYINADDEAGQRLIAILGEKGIPAESLSIYEQAIWKASDIDLGREQTRYSLQYRMREIGLITSPLLGVINVQNTMMAYAILSHFGFSYQQISQSFLHLNVAGRFQKVFTKKDVLFLIDYAHTPDALEKAIDVALNLVSANHKLIVLFGAGGDRDRTKRPLMAQATKKADLVIVTSDNPRTEDPQIIIKEICTGFEEQHYLIESDRAKAIALAYNKAQSGDVVLIAGKGHEEYQIIGTEKIHFSDREEVLKLDQ